VPSACDQPSFVNTVPARRRVSSSLSASLRSSHSTLSSEEERDISSRSKWSFVCGKLYDSHISPSFIAQTAESLGKIIGYKHTSFRSIACQINNSLCSNMTAAWYARCLSSNVCSLLSGEAIVLDPTPASRWLLRPLALLLPLPLPLTRDVGCSIGLLDISPRPRVTV
jgi:hypothetical protein